MAISAALHASLLLAALIAFPAQKYEDAQEFVPVEIVSDPSQSQVSKGEKTAKPALKPAIRVDKIADVHKPAPLPPVEESKKDAPTPPPPLKRIAEPSEAEAPPPPTPPKRIAAAPPPPPPVKQPPAKEVAAKEPPKPAPRPAPPEKAQAKAAPEPEREEPREAEVVKPKPETKPEQKPKAAAEAPTPPKNRPKESEAAQAAVERPKAKPRFKLDEVAKLLGQKTPSDQPRKEAEASQEKTEKSDRAAKASKPKSGDEAAPKSHFDPANIANLLSHEKPARQAATGPEKTQIASLGAPTATGPRLSPSMQAKIDAYTVEHYRRCWAAALALDARSYTPRVEFRLTRAGSLEGAPRLVNPSANASDHARAEQALAAVRRCSPMPIPPDFAPYYDYWRVTELDMKDDM